jgi:hypothetical protein
VRSERIDPTIGVSCGHRVPRRPVVDGVTKRYWCEACGEFRMSGGRSSGVAAFDFLLELRDECASRELAVKFPRQLAGYQLAVVEALGARAIINEGGT